MKEARSLSYPGVIGGPGVDHTGIGGCSNEGEDELDEGVCDAVNVCARGWEDLRPEDTTFAGRGATPSNALCRFPVLGNSGVSMVDMPGDGTAAWLRGCGVAGLENRGRGLALELITSRRKERRRVFGVSGEPCCVSSFG